MTRTIGALLATMLLLVPGCDKQDAAAPGAAAAAPKATITAPPKAETPKAPVAPTADPAKVKELFLKLGGDPAASKSLVAMGAPVGPLLGPLMVEQANAIAAAPKSKRWDLLKPLNEAIKVCRELGSDGVAPLTALAQATMNKKVHETLHWMTCGGLQAAKAPCQAVCRLPKHVVQCQQ